MIIHIDHTHLCMVSRKRYEHTKNSTVTEEIKDGIQIHMYGGGSFQYGGYRKSVRHTHTYV